MLNDFNTLIRLVQEHRTSLERHYGRGDSLMGKCIISSDNLRSVLTKAGFNIQPMQVWVLYEYFENCSDYCYEEHWINKVKIANRVYYVDCTMDQFQWAFHSFKLPRIYIGRKLPNWMLTREPSKRVLNMCGWTDWYEGGDYINNFDYWSYLLDPSNLQYVLE